MEAIILAGGMGTRLQSVVKEVPKPMAGINGKPFLAYLLDHLAKYEIEKVVLSVGYKHTIIQDYFKQNYRNIRIVYAVENEALGTGGAIVASLKHVDDNDVLVLNGDSYFDIDIKKLYNRHRELNGDITISLKYMRDFDRYGTVKIINNKIVGFAEKSFTKAGYINGGIYAVNKDMFHKNNCRGKFSFENDLLHKTIDNLNIYPFIGDGYFIDIGIPEDYQKAQYDFNLFEQVRSAKRNLSMF